MDKLSKIFSSSKVKPTAYIQEAEKVADIVSAGIKEGNYSEISKKIEELPSCKVEKEKYAFEHCKITKQVIAISGCVFFILAYIYFLMISAGIFLYSKENVAYAVIGLSCSVIVICLNGYIIYCAAQTIKFYRRYDKYLNILRYRNIEILDDLAFFCNVSNETAIKDLTKAVKQKLIPQGHFGKNNIIFIMSDYTYEIYLEKQAVYDRYYKKQLEERNRMKDRTSEIKQIMDLGQSYIDRIHESNVIIKDKVISQKLDRMERVVTTIFHEVDITPQKSDKLGLFLNYYLPTTQKLLEAYIEIDEKQIKGKTLEKTKKDIERSLDTINIAFEGILDKFYQEQQIDIVTDIEALEIMIKQTSGDR